MGNGLDAPLTSLTFDLAMETVIRDQADVIDDVIDTAFEEERCGWLEIIESVIEPIVLYGCEVWGLLTNQ